MSNSKGTGDAISATLNTPYVPPAVGNRKMHHRRKLVIPEKPAEAGPAIAAEFSRLNERTAAAQKRKTSPDYQPHDAVKRQNYSSTQLTEVQVAAIEVDYRSGLKPITQLCSEHRINRTTLYALAERRAWPLRGEIQRAMAETVQDHVVAAVAREQRIRQHGPSGADDPLDSDPAALADLLDDASVKLASATDANGQLLIPRGTGTDDQEPVTQRQLDEMGSQDTLIEEYAIAVGLVLNKHRTMAQTAVNVCDDLLQTHVEAIAAAKGTAERLSRDPAAMAKALEPLAKSLGLMLTNVQRAIDMQRQAFALDDSSGKGVPLQDLARFRAIQSGMARPEAPGALPAPPGNDVPAPEANPLQLGMGGYEALVREAERQGVRLA